MRPSNKQRSRNKSGNLGSSGQNNRDNRRPLGNIINRVFESAGPDGKVRGTPQQIIDKYQLLARDAQLAGDRVAEQSFLQHSEHYSRLLGEAQAEQLAQRQAFERDEERREDRRDGGEQRYDGQRRDEPRREDRRDDGGFGDRPRHDRDEQRLPQAQPGFASGLVTIDADDPYDTGLIETPESRSALPPLEVGPMPAPDPVPEPMPDPLSGPDPVSAPPVIVAEVVEAAPAVESPPVEVVAETPAPPKRGRPRRRAPSSEGETAAS